VKFEAEGQIDKAMACNCSICQRKGALMWFLPRSAMHLLTPEEDAATYLFNKHLIKHRFCPSCGIHPYGEARTPAGIEMAAISAPAGVLASP
ncbi:MAG TPA: GFA family protein, partial [Variovorax sp.]